MHHGSRWRPISRLFRILLAIGVLAVAPSGAAALPSGWGYELISPADTNGIDIAGGVGAQDGEHAWITELAPLSSEQSTGNTTTLAAARTKTGWALKDLSDPVPHNANFGLAAIANDASGVLLQSCTAVFIGCPDDIRIIRVRDGGERTLMMTVPRTQFPDPLPELVAASGDLSTAIVQINTSAGAPPLLAEDTHVQGRGLYASRNGVLEFLGVDENGVPLPCGAVLADDTQTLLGKGFGQSGLSTDGASVVFESPDPVEGCGPVDIFLRHGPTTRNISAPRNGKPDLGARFAGSTSSGDTVFFITASQLVVGDNDALPDIYVYNAGTDSVERVTFGADVSEAAVSPDGEYVYFGASRAIGGQGADGEHNVYVYHAGATAHVATAASSDIKIGHSMNTTEASPMTPDGRHLLFRSSDSLTGQATGGEDQVFQYSADEAKVVCISCPPNGDPPTTYAELLETSPAANVEFRHQSDDGTTVVFVTRGRLSAEDVNDSNDVYMWKRGTLSLITSGHGETTVAARGISADGNSIFFVSTERLLPEIAQDNMKMYVARKGGGFPLPPIGRPGCVEDECQPVTGEGLFKRPVPKSTARMTRVGVAAAPRFELRPITDEMRRRCARTGRLELQVMTSEGGRARATLFVRVGRSWRRLQVRVGLSEGKKISVMLKLPQKTRERLAERGALWLRVAVRNSGEQAVVRRAKFHLVATSRR